MSRIQHKKFFTFLLFSNYTNEISNQSISSIESEHATKTKTCQPMQNENAKSIQLKHESITVN